MRTFFFVWVVCIGIYSIQACKPVKSRSLEYNTPAGEVKLITYNIRQSGLADEDGEYQWKNRCQATAEMIQREAPSVFGIQEGLTDQIQFIEQSFPQYARVGIGRDDGKEAGEMTAVFYLPEYFELLEQGTIWLSETPEEVSRGWDAACNRTMTRVCLREKATGKTFYYFNTHLDHMGEVARDESVKLITGQIRETVPEGAAVVFGGDLNSTIDDPIFEPLKEFMAVARETASDSDHKGTFNGFGSAPGTVILDHIFYRNVKAKSLHTLTEDYGIPFISDHYPVVFLFAL